MASPPSLTAVLSGEARWAIAEGDCLSVLRGLPEGCVHCVVTSPPYYGLRDYGTARWEGGDPGCQHEVRRWEGPKQTQGAQSGHASRRDRLAREECHCGAVRVDEQIGMEATPDAYIARLVEVFEEVRRVLRTDGTLWLNLGDGYANDAKFGGSTGGLHPRALHGNTSIGRRRSTTGLKPKDLLMMPARVALALQEAGWWLRSDIIWCKTAPMPESVTDRPTSAHEHIFLLSKSARYFYDAAAVRVPSQSNHGSGNGFARHYQRSREGRGSDLPWQVTADRNLWNYWLIDPEPSSLPHYAGFPSELPRRCILAGTSARGVCPACGAPWRRGTERTDEPDASAKGSRFDRGKTGVAGMGRVQPGQRFLERSAGWQPTCACDAGDPVPALVLDPFAGTSTTGVVALELGRRFLGIELSPEYAELSRRRLNAAQNGLRLTKPPEVPEGQLSLLSEEAKGSYVASANANNQEVAWQ